MGDVAIRVEGLGKRYRLGGSQAKYHTLRDQFRKWVSPRNALRVLRGGDERPEFWALKDVSFEVKTGEVIGIIGRNGAGKSTLLKILSRITEPTEGGADIHGRVGSLLEVGTGFHPELTGRENIFLNGAILGMRRAEVIRKFDEIVAFAEVEKFIDTPVKFYSSGMYTRLAFAVAAHLEPEILVVDEVLAVGDAEFQKKCLGKMGDVARGGRTVLFVSHNMSAVQALCSSAILLERGGIAFSGSSAEAVGHYLVRNISSLSFVRDCKPQAIGVLSASVNIEEKEATVIAELCVDIQSDRSTCVTLDLRISDHTGTACGFGSLGTLDPASMIQLSPGVNRVVGQFDITPLAIGNYTIGLDVTQPDVCYFDRLENCLAFEIHAPPRPPAVRRAKQIWGYGSTEFQSVLVTASQVDSREEVLHQ